MKEGIEWNLPTHKEPEMI